MAKEPKILLNRLWVIFDVVCFSMALYMTVILIGRYDEDKSSTSIAYKKFAETDQDQYPTFSICLEGESLYQYNGSAVYEAYGISSANYVKMLQGQTAFRYEYNTALKLYSKTPLPLTYKTNFTFENMIQNSHEISDILKEAEFTFESQNSRVSYLSLIHI